MGSKSFLSRWSSAVTTRITAGISCILLLNAVVTATAPVPNGKPNNYPNWWFEREVIPLKQTHSTPPVWQNDYPIADDYAAANIGQLKNFATAAMQEFNAKLPGGSGDTQPPNGIGYRLNQLIGGWQNSLQNPTGTTDDFAAVNLGQVKAVAKLFYDRLIEVGYTSNYPWSGSASPADDFAIANLGQLKRIFAFDLTNFPIISNSTLVTADTGTSFGLTVAASNSPTSYSATGLPPGLTIDPVTGQITGIPTVGGVYDVTLMATNGTGTAQQHILLVIAAPPFNITSQAVLTVDQGSTVNYQVTSDGSPTSFNADGLPDGLSMDATTGLITGTAIYSGTYSVLVSATGITGTAIQRLSLHITPASPIILEPLQLSGEVNHLFGESLGIKFAHEIFAANFPKSWSASGLPPGLSFSTDFSLDGAAFLMLFGTPTTAGTYHVTLSATNVTGTGTADLEITVAPQGLPAIQLESLPEAEVGASYSEYISFSEYPSSITVTSSLPAGMTFGPDANGNYFLLGTPTTASGSGGFPITFAATNPVGTATVTLNLKINPQGTPSFGGPLTGVAGVGAFYGNHLYATENPTSYSASNLPSGLTVSADGYLSGAPTAAGVYHITLSATNGAGTGTGELVLTVLDLPVITSSSTAAAVVGLPFTYQATGTNSPHWQWPAGLPDGLALDTNTGVIHGTVLQIGTYVISLKASNAAGDSTPLSLTLTVTQPTAVPAINSPAKAFFPYDSDNPFQVTTSNGATSFTASGLPAGFSINEETGVISGFSIDPGIYDVTVSATNIHGTTSSPLELWVDHPLPVQPWQSYHLGSTEIYGGEDIDVSNGKFTVRGAGTDIGGTADGCRFVYQSMQGDGQMVARVLSVDPVAPGAKAGIMIRDSYGDDGHCASVTISSAGAVQFIRRATVGGTSTQTTAPGTVNGPVWLKLVRQGNVFTGYFSTDGVNWVLIDQQTVNMGNQENPVMVGLAVTSNTANTLCWGSFDLVAPVKPFTVALTSPANGSSFVSASNVVLSADVQNGTGNPTGLQFFAGEAPIGQVSSAPYAFTWSQPMVGAVSLSALAIDNTGASALSPSVNISVNLDGSNSSIPSSWFQQYGLAVADPNALAIGGSGLTYAKSYLLGLDPTVRDSDGDGIADGDAVALGQDPRAALLGFQVFTPLQKNH
jgi:hypothetical protein